MTLAEYEDASRLRRLGYRLYRNPLLMMFVGPSLVFLFERRFPQRGMSRRILLSVLATNLALVGWALGWSLARRLADVPDRPGHDAGRRRGDRRLDALHPAPVRGHLLPGRRTSGSSSSRRSRAARTSSCRARSPGRSATPTSTTSTTSARRSRTTTSAPPTSEQPMFARTPGVTVRSSVACAAAEALGRGGRVAGPLPGPPRACEHRAPCPPFALGRVFAASRRPHLRR